MQVINAYLASQGKQQRPSQPVRCSVLPPASWRSPQTQPVPPGQYLDPVREAGARARYRTSLDDLGVPVVTAPADIDVTTAEQFRAVLLHSAAGGHAAIVVDMTCTRFCNLAGLTVLVQEHKRQLADGGELRLIIPAGSAAARVFAITHLDGFLPVVGSLDEALRSRPAVVIRPLRPAPPAT